MGNSLVQTNAAIPALAMDEQELAHVLGTSLYPGASVPSIKMVVSYCRAAQLDPMQKPVHIVPMWDKNSKSMRDVIMPGVGLYRTQAARTGEYAGMSEPEYGPDITEVLGNVQITYPQWCKVVVKRLLSNGSVAEFPAKEFWKENYAVAGKDTEAPNAMWKKRPYGQISKCAEAQALRKAFPEIGSQPTAEEMEGKTIDMGPAEVVPPTTNIQPTLPDYNDAALEADAPKVAKAIYAKRVTLDGAITTIRTKFAISEEREQDLRSRVEAELKKLETPAEKPTAEHDEFVEAMGKE